MRLAPGACEHQNTLQPGHAVAAQVPKLGQALTERLLHAACEPTHATKRTRSFRKLEFSSAFFPTRSSVRCQALMDTSVVVAAAMWVADCVATGLQPSSSESTWPAAEAKAAERRSSWSRVWLLTLRSRGAGKAWSCRSKSQSGNSI